jgi:hypothetical protein
MNLGTLAGTLPLSFQRNDGWNAAPWNGPQTRMNPSVPLERCIGTMPCFPTGTFHTPPKGVERWNGGTTERNGDT